MDILKFRSAWYRSAWYVTGFRGTATFTISSCLSIRWLRTGIGMRPAQEQAIFAGARLYDRVFFVRRRVEYFFPLYCSLLEY